MYRENVQLSIEGKFEKDKFLCPVKYERQTDCFNQPKAYLPPPPPIHAITSVIYISMSILKHILPETKTF